MKPEISVITTVINCEKYIEESIKSIASQTFENFEHIIIDDGSTDGTAEILYRLAEKDNRIKFVELGENLGRIKSLNIALERSEGKFIAIQDADDISLPERFEKQLSYFNENPDCVLLGSDIYVVDQDLNVISQPVRPEKDMELRFNLLFKCTLANPSIMYKRDILEKNNIRFEDDFPYAEDFRIFTHIIKHGNVNNLKERLVLYRNHISNSSNSNVKIIIEDSAKVVVDNFREFGIDLNIQDAARIRRLISSKSYEDKHLFKDMRLIFRIIKSFQEKHSNKGNKEVVKTLKKMLKWPGKKNTMINPKFSLFQISILNYYIKQTKLLKQNS
ncbi:MAG TPA: glycosyltransferase [Ignavibacteria bacterium]|nr:glycosyltransferase [Ignavibacteria bacterium]HMR40085.1 glycosyltransferase [Ignavibacteria bacterium]